MRITGGKKGGKVLLAFISFAFVVLFSSFVLAFDTYINNSNIFVNGSVGIGDNTPDGMLEVRNSGTGDIFNLNNRSGGSMLTVLNDGRVGIGTASPAVKFVISDTGTLQIRNENTDSEGRVILEHQMSSAAGGAKIDLRSHGDNYSETFFGVNMNDSNLILSDNNNLFVIGNHDSVPLIFGTNNLERMRITGSGNVGIGTTNPSQTLHVNGTFSVYNKTGTLGLFQNAGGNVGIGTTNVDAKLDIEMGSSTNGRALGIRESTEDNFYIQANFSGTNQAGNWITMMDWSDHDIMTWRGDGHVGINTTTPATALEVNGDITETCKGGAEAHRWTAGNNHCFIRFTGTVNISVARRNCQGIGGYLATLTTADENDWVVNAFGQADVNNDWIGLSDIRTEGTYEWITGEQAWEDDNNNLYTDWNSGEPNDSTPGEDCVAFANNGDWNDYPCDTASVNGYICEKDW